jgi:hypothetical protein
MVMSLTWHLIALARSEWLWTIDKLAEAVPVLDFRIESIVYCVLLSE